MALTISDLRARVETDFDDSTLQRILDAAEEEVVRHTGNGVAETETHLARGARSIALQRRSLSISTIVERRSLYSDAVTLDPNDYRMVGDYRLLRLTSGDNPASTWGTEVTITYAPEIDEAMRERVILDLCQLDVDFRSYETEGVGDWSGSQADYADRRLALLRQIHEGRSLVV